ncbi:MAG: hypothetical protein AAFY59_12725, partial [Pseudomonadota bacterium]
AYLGEALWRTERGVEGRLPGDLAVLWTEADEMGEICSEAAVVVAPKIETSSDGCILLSKPVLAEGGAHALFRRKDGSVAIVSVADIAGDRRWTHRRQP